MIIFSGLTGRCVLACMLVTMLLLGDALAGPHRGKTASITIPPAPEMYATEPQTLAPSHCGVCHPALYRAVKDSGGRHRFACQKCHDVISSHNPDKAAANRPKPKCPSCHDRPHGVKAILCAECHATPHTPQKLSAEAPIRRLCFECHAPVRDRLAAFKSKHSKIACMTCHKSHGYKPSCFLCHKPHQQGQTLSTCLACHPPHMPRQIQYGKELPSEACGSCHAKIYAPWERGLSRHKAIACVTCHKERHRTIPACSDCHGKPHSPAYHERFPRCLTCHIDVHDLPVMPLKQKRKT